VNGKCQACNVNSFSYRCLECFSHPSLCRDCCLATHKLNPYHSVERWSGGCFVRHSLYDLGLILHTGHHGEPCPSYSSDSPTGQEVVGATIDNDNMSEDDGYEDLFIEDVLWIVHATGVFQMRIRYCNCDGCPDRHIQLLRHQLFPATTSSPQTAFTFAVLDYFAIDALECKTSAMNFFNKLRRQTNNAFPHRVPVSFAAHQENATNSAAL
jgi:hypothetical protein